MAEFCLDCWNKLHGTEHSKTKYVFSKDFDLCEGCGKMCSVVIMEYKTYYMYKLRWFFLPFRIIFYTLYIMSRILISPYLIYKYIKIAKSINKTSTWLF